MPKDDNDQKMKVFVYGTLMKGQWNHSYLVGQNFIGGARLDGYEMYQVRSFPGIIRQSGESVYGELYEVDHQTINNLDKLEDEGNMYKRVLENVMTIRDGRLHKAYAYVWLMGIRGCNKVDKMPWGIAIENY